MSCPTCQSTGVISSNQIVDVGLLKPRCADFCGNSLNDWVKWLAEKQCEIDWSSFDLSCLNVTGIECQTQDEKCVIDKILNALCTLQDCCTETIERISIKANWNIVTSPRGFKTGNQVILTGALSGSNLSADLFQLPSTLRPQATLTIPIAHTLTPDGTFNVFLRIATNGTTNLFFTGTQPVDISTTIYLDGVTYFVS